MDIDRFIGTNSQVWDQLAELVARAERRGVGGLDGAELDELVRLYQRVATHLSYARTEFRDPALSAKLSRLVARSGAVVYGSRPRPSASGWPARPRRSRRPLRRRSGRPTSITTSRTTTPPSQRPTSPPTSSPTTCWSPSRRLRSASSAASARSTCC